LILAAFLRTAVGSAHLHRKEFDMPTAYVQEFQIVGDDNSTTNYDAVTAELDLGDTPPDGLLIHTAGFDREAGVFRVFDVWETREQGERFIKERLMPVLERMGAAATERGDTSFTPPSREGWYGLHDAVTR
jgi:hypothetical protein